MPENQQPGHQYLSADHARSTETELEWDQDNQQWWDWICRWPRMIRAKAKNL